MKLEEYVDSFKVFSLSRKAGVLTVRMHYREGPMVWTALAHRELPRLLHAIAQDEDNRVVLLIGTGDSFIRTPEGYGDVYRSGKVKPSDWERGLREARQMIFGLLDLEVPVVAAVNGPVTGHAELILLCDAVVCTEDTFFRTWRICPGVWCRATGSRSSGRWSSDRSGGNTSC